MLNLTPQYALCKRFIIKFSMTPRPGWVSSGVAALTCFTGCRVEPPGSHPFVFVINIAGHRSQPTTESSRIRDQSSKFPFGCIFTVLARFDGIQTSSAGICLAKGSEKNFMY